MNRLSQLTDGLRDTLHFSNSGGLLYQRLLARNAPFVHYEWKGKWHLFADPRVYDHFSIKEVLAKGVYDSAILASAQNQKTYSYVNVGAHVGAFDIAVAALGLQVTEALSIELNPKTFCRLAFNISVNDMDHVHCINAGVAGERGTFSFSARSNSLTDGLYSERSQGTTAEGQSIRLETLDALLNETKLGDRSFNLLKLDCESAEYDIVERASPQLLRRFAHVVIELHEPPPHRTPESLYAKLSACGFHTSEPPWKSEFQPQLRFWSRRD